MDHAELTRGDAVLEVGPGFGMLTRELAARAGRVVAVELDRRFKPVLAETLGDVRNVSLVWGDVLRTPLELSPPRGSEEKKVGGFKIVSNLPYEITTPFLWKFLGPTNDQTSNVKRHLFPDVIVLLLQREVAERICAKPPRMNLLALLVQTFGTAEVIRRVPARAFYPPPRVESALVRIVRNPQSGRASRKVILTLAKRAFAHPRKKLSTTLGNNAWLSHSGVNTSARPAELSLGDWERIGEQMENSV